jgi:hypothetical protein
MKIKDALHEVNALPLGTELAAHHRYGLMAKLIEARDGLWPWEVSRRRLFNALLAQLAR